jgi:CheY-like chemotaxis protein
MQILIAEDDLLTQKSIQLTLRQLGFDSDCAGNGFEVIEILKNKSYELILMDIEMPMMDGIETTRYIRENFKQQNPKIIAVTGQDISEELKSLNFTDFLSKPFFHEDLVQVLAKFR